MCDVLTILKRSTLRWLCRKRLSEPFSIQSETRQGQYVPSSVMMIMKPLSGNMLSWFNFVHTRISRTTFCIVLSIFHNQLNFGDTYLCEFQHVLPAVKFRLFYSYNGSIFNHFPDIDVRAATTGFHAQNAQSACQVQVPALPQKSVQSIVRTCEWYLSVSLQPIAVRRLPAAD